MEIKTSLIVSTYNWEQALKQCLKSICRQTLLPFEVLIADDGSGDATRSLVEYYKARFPVPLHHIWQPDEGFQLAKIRNKAIVAAAGNYVVQIDGDILLHSKFICDHVQMAKKAHFTTGSRVLLSKETSEKIMDGHTLVTNSPKIEKNRLNNLYSPLLCRFLADRYHASPRYISVVRGCNMAFWRDDLIAVNGYDEAFVGWGREDSDIAIRLHNRGIKKRVLKFGAIEYHLYHKEADRAMDANNTIRMEQALKKGLIRCEKGLDQYL